MNLQSLDTARYLETRNEWRFPWGTAFLVGLLAGLFVWVNQLAEGSDEAAAYLLLASGAKVNGAVDGGEWYRLFSATFLHGKLAHLLVNGTGIVLVGMFLEGQIGATRLWALAIVCGLAGNTAAWVTSDLPSVGASPAMYGFWGALLVIAFWRWEHYSANWKLLFWVFPGALGLGVMGVGLVHSGVNLSLHLGGLMSGLLLGFLGCLEWPWLRRTMVALVVVAFSLAGFSLMRTVGGFVEPGVTVTDQVVRVDQQGVPAYVVPKGWEPGTFIEGSCEVGMPAPAGEPACFVDPYHAVLVVGSRTRMERSPVGALAWDKDSPTAGPVRYQEDVVFWREDTKRDLAFALLVFHRWAPQYGTLFAAVAMDPAEAQTP